MRTKIPVGVFSRFNASLDGVLFGFKSSHVFCFAPDGYLDGPFILILGPIHALATGLIIFSYFLVLGILTSIGFSQIAYSVIESIAVVMISLFTFVETKNLSVQFVRSIVALTILIYPRFRIKHLIAPDASPRTAHKLSVETRIDDSVSTLIQGKISTQIAVDVNNDENFRGSISIPEAVSADAGVFGFSIRAFRALIVIF